MSTPPETKVPGAVAAALQRPESTPPPLPLEDRLGWVLRAGVLLSMAFVVAGTAVGFGYGPERRAAAGLLSRLRAPMVRAESPSALLGNVGAWPGRSLAMVGILVLIATPLVRVASSCVVFRRQRDLRFTLLSLAVLLLLLTALLLGRAG